MNCIGKTIEPLYNQRTTTTIQSLSVGLHSMSFYLFPNSLMFADLLQLRYSDLQAFIHINEFKNIHSDTNYLVKILDSKFHSPVRKRQNESDTKMFQNNRESFKISSRA